MYQKLNYNVMKKERKPKGYWGYDNCKKEALKYITRNGFQINNRVAYNISRKNGWLDDICSHMVLQHKQNNYWTKEVCQEEALKYSSRSELKRNNASMYAIALQKGWLDEICSHMVHLNEIWDFDKCKIEALKYTSRREFQYGEKRSAYNHARVNGFLDEICSHMNITGTRFKRCIYVFEFDDNHAYIGLTYNINEREIDHINRKKSQVYKHIKKTNSKYELKQLTDYIEIDLAVEKEEYYLNDYINNGWCILNKVKTGGLGGTPFLWDFDKCKLEAMKYNYRNDFSRGSGGAYSYALKYDILDDICSHMGYRGNIVWTDNELEILKENYDNDRQYCFKNINRAKQSIISKASQLKLSKQKPRTNNDNNKI